jgi:hypothetical protein
MFLDAPMARTKQEKSPNLYGMIQNVLVSSMAKGQAPLFVVAGIFALMVVKMPAEDVSKLVFRILDALEHGYLFGYVGTVLSVGGWFVHAKVQRRTIHEEMKRLAEHRTKLQLQQGTDLESSEGR